MFEKINATELATVACCGVALILSVWMGQENIASAIGGGLVGYLGAVYVKGGGDGGTAA